MSRPQSGPPSQSGPPLIIPGLAFTVLTIAGSATALVGGVLASGPIARFGGLVRLITVSLLLPASRPRSS